MTEVQHTYIYIQQTKLHSLHSVHSLQEYRFLLFSMQLWATVSVLGLLITGSWAQGVQTTVNLAECDSPEAEAAALAAQDYLNAQHTHGYKYILNRIEGNKVISRPNHEDTYLMELDFLETTCHVLDPTPVSLCPVRQQRSTAVEADCDFAVTKGLSIVAFKCKTEIETDDDCLGCPHLLPLNDTDGLQLIEASLDSFNQNNTLKTKFALFEIGRMTSQIVSGVPQYFAEYAIIGTNCSSYVDDSCIPQNHTVAIHGLCLAEGSAGLIDVDCKIFNPTQTVHTESNNATMRVQQLLHAHTFGPQHNPTVHGLRHHKLTALHDPAQSGLISAESTESAEVVAVLPQEAHVVKREVAAPEKPAVDAKVEKTPILVDPIALSCPGKKKHF
ncbi:alpha-2-HS-glycoprotein 2 [Danio rerio]|uniref:Alpha-2-HS-glycoprotein 2 n=1 Tax=Danio rerio TaxID=7955 RepID=A5WWI5_DANRE|nr:alpha-2-HS-glycoprotein 2 [Danio rerio]|eukprot:NP_001093499.1 si:ch73-252g14.4 [Danio rerio]